MGSMSELMDRARHRISVDEYHKMADAGVLSHEELDTYQFKLAPKTEAAAIQFRRVGRAFSNRG